MPDGKKKRVCLMCRRRNMDTYGICPECQNLNEQMRGLLCDLTGKWAVVTGGRIKIGYAVTLKLLRMGAEVIVVTRYPKDAWERYREEVDYDSFRERLYIIGFDLMQVHRIGELTAQIAQICGGQLDILINNAAQTVKKSTEYYVALEAREETLRLAAGEALLDLRDSSGNAFLPVVSGQYPDYGERADDNSWVRRPEEVTPRELLEVQLINVTAPFLLTNGVRQLLAYDRDARKFVINVSSVEGRFNKKPKLARHVHTNMAKASLNMMTHSIATEFARDGIYVYACDPGWVSNQFPPGYEISQEFTPYLTYEDGANRVLYPVLLHMEGEPVRDYGSFYKDYRVIDY